MIPPFALAGLRCALYARRSKEEHQAASIEVQLGEGGAFITRYGGTCDPEHVFVDADHGRAEFKRRPALLRLLNAAARGDFDAVIVRDESRLGGDANRTSLLIQDLLDHEVRLFFYFSGEEVTIEGAVDRFMINVRNFASELEREKISQRTHEHLRTKARRGLVSGGRVYGYDNLEVREGDKRVRVEYRVNPAQAEVVREIFTRYAKGEGLRTVAKDLNARGIPSPKVGKRGSGSWSYTGIREMLRRERYRGKLVWGQKEKTYRGGTKVRIARAESEWVVVDAPELRIVSDELWAAVQARIGKSGRRANGRQARGTPSRYLLTGLAVCGVCGGPITVANVKVGHENVKAYCCAWHKDRGSAVCPSSTRRPVEVVDAELLGWMKQHVLDELVIDRALAELRRRLTERAKEARAGVPELEAEAKKLKAEIGRLGETLLATSDPPHVVLRMIGEREARLAQVEARLASVVQAPAVLSLEVRRMEREARARLADFTALLGRGVVETRASLARLLSGPLTLLPVDLPEGRRFEVSGTVALESLILIEGVPSGTRSIGNGSEPGKPELPLLLRLAA